MYNMGMDFSSYGLWLGMAAIESALVRALTVWLALRKAAPSERPEILRSLPGMLPGYRTAPRQHPIRPSRNFDQKRATR
jgi:hypothetical protein